jgi:uncharacterized membrane protein
MPPRGRLWRPTRMESALKDLAGLIGLLCELATVAVVALGALEALARLLAVAVNLSGPPALKKQVWVRFAAWILLALEFALAADIVRTAIAPSWDDIGQLAAIAAIRTFLNYFLAKDVESFERDRAEAARRERAAGET